MRFGYVWYQSTTWRAAVASLSSMALLVWYAPAAHAAPSATPVESAPAATAATATALAPTPTPAQSSPPGAADRAGHARQQAKPIGPLATSTLTNLGTVTASSVPARVGNTTASAPPANRTGPGDTLHWVVEYTKTSPEQASVVITDLFDKTRHTYVPDSLVSPPGSTEEWTTDGGTTYLPNDQGTDTNGVRVTRQDVDATADIPAPPAGGFTAATGGDGYNVAFFGNNVYSIYHHEPSSFVDCHDKSTGVRCPGYVKTYAGYNTGQTTNAVVFGNHLFWAPVNAGRAVVMVLNLTTGLLDDTVDTGPAVTIGGHNSSKDGWAVGSNFYFLSRNDTINCVSMVAPYDPCAGQPYSLGLPGTPNVSDQNALADGGHLLPFGTRIYTVAERLVNATNTVYLMCFDTTTNAACAGTATVNLTADFGGAPRSAMPFHRLTAGGADAGVCVQPVVAITIRCYDTTLAYQAGDPYAALAVAFPIVITWNGTGQGPATGTRVYMPMANSGAGNDIGCFDWATQATCPNFPITTTDAPPAGWGAATRPYTVQQDPDIPNCFWENGDAGLIVPFDGTTGELGCDNTQTSAEVDAAAFFCDGATHITGWDEITINDVFLLEDGSIEVTVRDENGAIVPGFDAIAPTAGGPGVWTVDLSTIPYSGTTTSLTVEVVILNGDPDSWETGDPRFTVTWAGDQGMQVCFDTTVLDVCPLIAQATPQGIALDFISTAATSVTTDEETTDTQNADAAFDFLYNDQCFAYHVYKVANEAVATLYQPIDYDITVTNVGRTALTSITVTDDVSGWQANATLVAGSLFATTGTVSGPTGGIITWTGDLGIGASAVISYQITVNATAAIGSTLSDVAAPGEFYGACELPSAAPERSVPVGSAVSVTQQPSACQVEIPVEVPTLRITQQVCHSVIVANCRSGVGPWVSETIVPNGSTAYWRITVTNTSAIDITGITLVDRGGRSNCVAVAGTFNLAAGQSAVFYCSTARVVSTVTNIILAQFVPEFAPPGTPPTIVGPAEAVARVLPPPLPITGVAMGAASVAGVSLIAIGVALLALAGFAWRRRETE